MNYTIKIKRQKDADSKPYWQSFDFESDGSDSVISVLRELNRREDLRDQNGDKANIIDFDCGCLIRKCGACAMVINNKPSLACSTFLKDAKNQTVTVEPLSKFKVVRDLKVDREPLYDALKDMKIYLEKRNENVPTLERNFQSAKCLLCGCCLEICPNYSGNSDFYGAMSMVNTSRILDQEKDSTHLRELKQSYNKHYYHGCGKSFSCQTVCPANIPIEELLVHSNAVSIWKKPKWLSNLKKN